MRTSDWSSDVCSSDLRLGDRRDGRLDTHGLLVHQLHLFGHHDFIAFGLLGLPDLAIFPRGLQFNQATQRFFDEQAYPLCHMQPGKAEKQAGAHGGEHQKQQRATGRRSEEHTSELQSLMRISYAVFCLKQTKKNNTTETHTKTENIE